MIRLLIIVAIVLLYLVGLLATLFGPFPGGLLSVSTFVVSAITFVYFLGECGAGRAFYREGGFLGRAAPQRSIRSVLWGIRTCLAFTLVSFALVALTSRGDGVREGTGPVFASRDEYLLNNHGKFVAVSRGRYVVMGASFVFAWHSFMIGFALFQLHLVLFGNLPHWFRDADDGAGAVNRV